jgi:hypothetical protein
MRSDSLLVYWTIALPRWLRELVEHQATAQGVSAWAIVRDALERSIQRGEGWESQNAEHANR